jgi:uncharacterized protein
VTRVVADTNVYISALMFGGLPAMFLELGLAGAFMLVVSTPLLDELEERLRGKFAVASEDVVAIRSRLLTVADRFEPEIVLDVIRDDPDDNRILECAVVGRADVIVSGDRHLLRLRSHEGIPILTARQFLEAIGLAPDPI